MPSQSSSKSWNAAEAFVLHFRRLKALLSRKEPATLDLMIARAELSAALHELTPQDRAGLAVELIDSLGDEVWSDEALARLAEEREAEMESGAVLPLSYEEFLSGLNRPSGSA